MAAVEVVIVKAVEHNLITIIERLVDEIELRRDTWMEEFRILAVTNEENIAYQGIQAVTQPDFLLICYISEESFYLALGIYLWLHLITLIVETVEIFLLHLVSTLMEHTVQDPVGDERTGKAILLEVQAVALNLLTGHAEGWSKLSEQTMYAIYRNFPDTEEAEHVVDTVSIKVLRHIQESAGPPLATVLQHLIPVISRESPVLTVNREVIRWSTCLTVHVEVLRLHPDITTVTMHTDRNITLQDDPLSLGMLVCLLHLLVQNELHEVEKLHVLVRLGFRVGQILALSLIPDIMVWPLSEVGSTILVAQVRILCVRHEPLLCFQNESLEIGSRHYLFTFLFEYLVQVIDLEIIYLFIIYLGQAVQLFTFLLCRSTSLGILQLWKCMKISIHRMDGEDADAAIWITVRPGMGDGGIIDWQKLKNFLTGRCHKINHGLEITEIAHSGTLLAAQGEYWHLRSGKLAVVKGEECLV